MSHPEQVCPEECPGPQSKWLPNSGGGGGEGYYVQLCTNPEKSEYSVGGVNFCGDGPDVLIFYQTEFPPDEEVYKNTDIL